jgi:cytochrome c
VCCWEVRLRRGRAELEMRCKPLAMLAVVLCVASCESRNAAREQAVMLTGGDPDKGVSAIGRYGCGSCHEIPGIRAARGTVGPPLGRIAVRGYLAGRLSNTPANMMQWIQHPQHVERGTAMPELGVTEADARDITAFLYTLR